VTAVLVLVLVGIVGSAFGAGDSDDPGADDKATDSSSSSPSDDPTPESSPPPSEPEPSESAAPACDPLPAKRIAELGDGQRKGVQVVSGFAVALPETDKYDPLDKDFPYLAAAVRVTKRPDTADVVLVMPVAPGDGLLLATEPALPYFNWGDRTADGSPLDELRDAVES
jgi:hypothetical protein